MGGHVFDLTTSIVKDNIDPTLDALCSRLEKIFPNMSTQPWEILGSAGKKPISGDIDLAVDEKDLRVEIWELNQDKLRERFLLLKKRSRTSTDHQLFKRAMIEEIGEKMRKAGLHVDTKGAISGALFLAFPQYGEDGEETGEYVQIDINFGNRDWLQFAYYSSAEPDPIKGLHRTQLMLALFTVKNHVFSHNYGVKNKETQEIVASYPYQAVELLNELYGFDITRHVLNSYTVLQNFLRDNLPIPVLRKVYDTYLRVLDKTRCDIPEDLQGYWATNQSRLELTGKFLPESSKLNIYRSTTP